MPRVRLRAETMGLSSDAASAASAGGMCLEHAFSPHSRRAAIQPLLCRQHHDDFLAVSQHCQVGNKSFKRRPGGLFLIDRAGEKAKARRIRKTPIHRDVDHAFSVA